MIISALSQPEILDSIILWAGLALKLIEANSPIIIPEHNNASKT